MGVSGLLFYYTYAIVDREASEQNKKIYVGKYTAIKP
jgi:hypothetical protein